MPEFIRDGKGTGYLAGVSDENRLLVGGVTVSKEHHTNFNHQDSYNLLFEATPTGAGDVFLYIKNTGEEKIVCEGFNVHCPTDEEITICLGGNGDPLNGTDTEPANLTAGSANRARGTFQYGNDITGRTGGTDVAEYAIAGSNNSVFRNFDADIVIPRNQTMCMKATTGGIPIKGFVVMWHDHGGV